MRKWNELKSIDDIKVELSDKKGNLVVVDAYDIYENREKITPDSYKLLKVTNKYYPDFPECLQTYIDSYIKYNSINELADLLEKFDTLRKFVSTIVQNPQTLFLEYLNIASKDISNAFDIVTREASYSMSHLYSKKTDKLEIIEWLVIMLRRTMHYDEIPFLSDEYIDRNKVKEDVIDSLKAKGASEEVTDTEMDEAIDNQIQDVWNNDPLELIFYLDVEKAYKYVTDYYTIIVDDNGSCLIDNFYL